MSEQTSNTNNPTTENDSNRPSHYVRKRSGHGRNPDFETIGVAWARENGGLYIRLYGTQVIDGGFYIVPNNKERGQ